MWAGMYIHMRVDWFFLLQECNARPSMDSRYAKFSSLASIVIGYWLNVFGPCTVYIAFLEIKKSSINLDFMGYGFYKRMSRRCWLVQFFRACIRRAYSMLTLWNGYQLKLLHGYDHFLYLKILLKIWRVCYYFVQLSSAGIVRLPKFEMVMAKSEANSKPVLADEDVYIATM